MAVAYTTAQIDSIIAGLEAGLKVGYARISDQNGELEYRSVADIRNAIAYFNGLYPDATDAPASPAPKVRTLLFYGGKGY